MMGMASFNFYKPSSEVPDLVRGSWVEDTYSYSTELFSFFFVVALLWRFAVGCWSWKVPVVVILTVSDS